MNVQPNQEMIDLIVKCGRGDKDALYQLCDAVSRVIEATVAQKRDPTTLYGEIEQAHILFATHFLVDGRWDVVAKGLREFEQKIQEIVGDKYFDLKFDILVGYKEVGFICIIVR